MFLFIAFNVNAQEATEREYDQVLDIRYNENTSLVYIIYHSYWFGGGEKYKIEAIDINSGEKKQIYISNESNYDLTDKAFEPVYLTISKDSKSLEQINVTDNTQLNVTAKIIKTPSSNTGKTYMLAKAKIEIFGNGKLIIDETRDICLSHSSLAFSIYKVTDKKSILVTSATNDCHFSIATETAKLFDDSFIYNQPETIRNSLICSKTKDNECIEATYPSFKLTIDEALEKKRLDELNEENYRTAIETQEVIGMNKSGKENKETLPTDKTLFYASLGVLVVGLISIIGSVIIVRRRKVESIG